MYPITPPAGSLFSALADLDHQVALQTQQKCCGACSGPLHFSTWTRKPRGAQLPEHLAVRWGLCCGHCRKRTLPPSVLFAGRRVYLKAIMLLIVAARQRDRLRPTMKKLRRLFDVSADTIRRWLRAFLDDLPRAPGWRRIRGQVPPTVRDAEVPGALLDLLLKTADVTTTLITTCRLVPPL